MCYRHMMIRTHLDSGQKVTFVPCGKCEECRDSNRMQWQFRLRTELDYCRKIGWHIGFFTLTYDDAHLPHLPDIAFKGAPPSVRVPCFSRYDVKTFIGNIRKRLNERYGVSGLRYLVACEYGSSTKRPHMHGLICFPSTVSGELMHALIKEQWKNGFVFPRDYRGGLDSHGYRHSSFLIDGDVEGAAQYAAKYVCKDLDFYRSIADYELVDRRSDEWRFVKDCMPFHCQSQGIGRSYLASLDLSDMLKVLRHGESFLGKSKTVNIPLYIRNKILYNNKYEFDYAAGNPDARLDWSWSVERNKFVYTPGKGEYVRHVLREPSDVYKEHFREIYAQKHVYYEQLFKDISSVDYWIARRVAPTFANRIVMSMRGVDPSRLADYYLSYYGVKPEYWQYSDSAVQYMVRYLKFVPVTNVEPWSIDSNHEFDRYAHVIDEVCSQLHLATSYDIAKRKRERRLKDMYSHLA